MCARGRGITFDEESFLKGFFFCFFHLSAKESKLKGPPGPKAERLMVAAFAAKGLKSGTSLGCEFSEYKNDLPERGTTPSRPWNSLNAKSKLGPSSKIGPLAPCT